MQCVRVLPSEWQYDSIPFVALTGSMAVSDVAPDAGVLDLSVVVKNLQFLPGANDAVSLNLESLNTANIRAAE